MDLNIYFSLDLNNFTKLNINCLTENYDLQQPKILKFDFYEARNNVALNCGYKDQTRKKVVRIRKEQEQYSVQKIRPCWNKVKRITVDRNITLS